MSSADLTNEFLAHNDALSSRASLPLSTISLARHIRLMDDNDRFDASRYSTSCSKFGSWKLPSDEEGDGGAGGDAAMVLIKNHRCYEESNLLKYMVRLYRSDTAMSDQARDRQSFAICATRAGIADLVSAVEMSPLVSSTSSRLLELL